LYGRQGTIIQDSFGSVGERSMTQPEINAKNVDFWNELCGSGLARSLGITEISPENLRRFDEAYMAIYPYLMTYVTSEEITDKKVLEIGPGYGTLGQIIASKGADYYGLDIAEGPVAMMHYRLSHLGRDCREKVQVGSALEIPYQDASFDYVYTIGCLHHTGNLSKAVSEVYRMLVPGGKAIVMLYNRHSFRQLVQAPLMRLRDMLSTVKHANFTERVRGLYDTNKQGGAAPHTDYVSQKQVRELFKEFSSLKIDRQNFDTYVFLNGRIVIPRGRLLNNLGRVLGLDLYVMAVK